MDIQTIRSIIEAENFKFADELTGEENQLITIAAQEGQNSWLKIQLARGERIPYPNRDPLHGGKVGHPSMMSYETMGWISEKVTQGGLAQITKEELLSKLYADLSLPAEDLMYIFEIPDNIFQDWMQEVAWNRIHDNDAWGKTAALTLRELGIKIDHVLKNTLSQEDKQTLAQLELGLKSIFEPKNTEQMRRLLDGNKPLYVAMVSAHHNWRETRYGDKIKGQEITFNIDQELNGLRNIVSTAMTDTQLEKQISDLRERAHCDSTQSSVETFELMLQIAETLEELAQNLGDEDPRVNVLLNQRNTILDTIRFDANPAIIGCIRHASQANVQEHQI
ncbi:MAG: hypothetical protein Kow0081_4740 [Candidatus Dojkabacteria bacterium]